MTRLLPSIFDFDYIDGLLSDVGNNVWDRCNTTVPYNIKTKRSKEGEAEFTILEFAIAGYSKKTVELTVEDDLLLIKIAKSEKDKDASVEMNHCGFSNREIRMKFGLTSLVDREKITADVNDGMLIVKIPYKGKDRKTIAIG